MRGRHLPAILALCVLAGLPPAAGLAQQGATQQARLKPQAEQQSQGVTTGSPLDSIKNAIDAQGDVSAATLKAVRTDPLAADIVAKGRAAGEDSAARRAAPQPEPPKSQPPARTPGPKSTKAIYGDIIIHK
ncbi:MAG: hypothetical protein HY916_08635 [Desulfovibrio sp.]|jgi:hypothetical protein|nr:hypothetical protein [Desulfovibrio sp.]